VIRWTAIVFVALCAIALVAWTYRSQLLVLIPSPPIVVTVNEDGHMIKVLQGQTIEVRLPSNRYSGYSWQQGIPVKFLQQTGDVTFTEDSPAKTPGDGVQSLSFRVTGAGTGPLFLSYLPDNDQNSLMPSKSFRVIVSAQ
jgi:predicted secreted protein